MFFDELIGAAVLAAAGANVALERPLDMPDWVSKELMFHSPFVVIAARGHADIRAARVKAGGKIPLALFCRLPHALRSIDGGMSGAVDDALRKHGAARQVVLTLPQLISWTDTADEAVKYFAGTATYTRSIHVPPDFFGAGKRVWLDLGVVKNLAAVTLNGRALGTLWKAPFRVDITAAAQPGENRLELQVTDLWPNRLIGDQRLPEAQRTTWTTWQPYRADSPLLPSGLLGPVVVRAVAEVPLLPTPGP